jgi:acetoin utilization deacetylase AcuC-like enzyme
LLHEGIIEATEIFAPAICEDEIILLTHDAQYLRRLNDQNLSEREQRSIGFPQSPALTLREKIITQGTIDCARYAISHGVSLNVAGGTHHAFSDHGEGFCLLNDFAVAARLLLSNREVSKVLIIDLDVHQGNGTASIFNGDPKVFTFSMHGAHNYPFRKELSDLDVPLPDGIGDEEYMSLLESHLPQLLDSQQPDLVFYLSGVDILSTDRFGKLNISMMGCLRRDTFVFRALKERSIPCAVSMGGGYSPDVRTIVEAHCQTYRAAREIYEL